MKINQETKLVLIEDLGNIFRSEKSKQRYHYCKYRCDCGNESIIRKKSVDNKKTLSCGCLNRIEIKKSLTKHGLRYHRLYHTWKNIVRRCTDKKSNSYEHYGYRGITVCERWLDFSNFIDDMYPSFQEGLSIDRINNDGNYEPSNCRWATSFVQSQNVSIIRSNNKSGYKGVTFDIKANKFRARINNNGKTINLGYFKNSIDGAKAYNNYVISNNLEHTLNML